MSTYGSLQGSFSSFSDDEKLNYALKIALSRLQTDLAADWFNEPTDFIPKQPLELYKNVIPSYASIQNFLLIDPDVDGNGKEMVTDKTVGDILSVSTNGSQFTLSDILDTTKVRDPSQFSSLPNSAFVDGASKTQIKLLGRNMFTRYKYWTSGLTGKNSLLEGNAVTGGGGSNTGTTPDQKEPFNAYITYTDNGSLSPERTWVNINGGAENSDHKKFYNKLISEGVELNIIDPNLKSDLTKKHPFLKLCLQVLTYTTRGSQPISQDDNNSSSGPVEKTDNIGFHNPLMEKALGDTNGFLSGAGYQIAGWDGSSWKSVTTSYGTPGYQNILYFLSNPGFILVYGQKNIDYGYYTSRSHPPMVSFIRYTGETLGDGIISQGPTLPAVEVSNDKDLFINTTENTIHRLKDDDGNKEWIPIGGSGNSDISFNDTKPTPVPDDFEENQLFVDTSHNIIFRVDDNNGNKSFKQISEKILFGTEDPSGKDGYNYQLYIRNLIQPELYYNYNKQWFRIGTGSGTSSGGTSGGTQPVDHQILTQKSNEIESVSSAQLLGTNYEEIEGSSTAYAFPASSTSLIYRFRFNLTWNDENNRGDTISEYKLQKTSNGTNWIDLKTFRLRNSIFSENFATIEHVIKKEDHNDITKIKLVGKSINHNFQQKIHYSYFTPTPGVVKPILELVTLGTRTIQAAPLFSKKPDSNIFYTDGNVGIGTDDPETYLHIHNNSGDWGVSSKIRLSTDILTDNEMRHSEISYFRGSQRDSTASDNYAGLGEGLRLSGNGTRTDLCILNKDGNVGIGTDNPSGILHIKQTGQIKTTSEGFNSGLLFENYNSEDAFSIGYGIGAKFYIMFSENINDTNDYTKAFTFTADGNVGIGTSNPKTKVYIKGDSLIINTENSAENNIQNRVRGGRIFLAGHANYSQACISGIDYRGSSSGTYKGGLAFFVYKDNNQNNPGLDPLWLGNQNSDPGAGMIEAMRIANNGNVGIGTTEPEKALHVKGNTIIKNEAKATDEVLLDLESNAKDAGKSYTTIKLQKGSNYGGLIKGYLEQNVGSGLEFFTLNNGVENRLMHMRSTGKVGIGTDDPKSKLHVYEGGVSIGSATAASAGNLVVAGSVNCQTINAVGTISFSSSHIEIDQNDINPVGSNRLVINTTTTNNTLINPFTSGTSGDAGAKVLFGTTGNGKDEVPVQFHKTREMSYKSNIVTFHDENSSGTDATAKIAEWSGSNTYNTGGNRSQNMGVYSVGNFWTEGSYVATSDKRIKENIREVDDSGALKKVRDISCVYYEYRDKLNKGYDTTIGFIAQQVREHLPLAISITTSEIPSVYKFIKDFTWETIIDVSNNTKQKLHFNDDIDISSNAYYKFYTTNDLSANDLERNEFDLKCCEDDLKSFVFDQSWNYVFLYGEIVKDLHTLDKQKLFALNFSATQEIDKIQQQQLLDISGNTLNIAKNETDIELLKLENRELKTENADLKTELATLKTQMTDVLARLSQLESN